MNQTRVSKGFDFLAPFYDFFVRLFFGDAIQKTQVHFLSEIKGASSVLIFGGGTGNILLKCLEINPTANYTYVDISKAMIASAKTKFSSENVQFVVGSYTDIPSVIFDIIITPFVLDCFPDKELTQQVIPQLSIYLNRKGLWLLSDFQKPKSWLSQFLVKGLYLFFNVTCGLCVNRLPEFQKALSDNGLVMSNQEINGLFFSAVYAKK